MGRDSQTGKQGAELDKIDFKKTDRPFYSGKQNRWDQITIPPMQFLAVDGIGPPLGDTYADALTALYPLAYGIKFAQKAQGHDFVVPPLEALWWSDKLDAFTENRRDEWQWRAMIRMPDRVTQADVDAARKPDPTADVAFTTFDEGPCLQTLHVGSYADEASVLADLHDRLMPELGLTFRGHHHEIYLSDPRRVAPEKLRTILRQPVQPI